jgi:gluconolactonase
VSSFTLLVCAATVSTVLLSCGLACAQKCEFTKLIAAGKLYRCRLAADSKAIKKEQAAEYGKCTAAASKRWGKAESIGSCPVVGDEAATFTLVGERSDAAVAALVPAPPSTKQARKCASSKVKHTGKYGDCRLKVHAKNVLKGSALDFFKCDDRLTRVFTKAETKGGAECPTSGDLEALRTQVASDADALVLAISGATTTTTTTTTTTLPAAPPTGSIGTLIYSQDFAGVDGAPWPAPWVVAGGVETADLLTDRARFRPLITGYSLARMHMPGAETNLDVLLTAEWADFESQGMGFYVRQNGGYLQQTVTHGQGYAVFVEGFRGSDGVGVWKEIDGNEIDLSINFGLSLDIMTGVPYRIRFRAYQADASSTRLLAKVWPVASSEPVAWDMDWTDNEPLLQGVSGGFALDAWSSLVAGPPDAFQFVDDLEIRAFENPLLGIGAAALVDEGFVFTEGPRWRAATSELLFTDITGDTIYSLTPPSTVNVFRTPSDMANGLANDVGGELLAAEHGTRRVSRTDGVGTVTTVADSYMGMSLNSPNDIAVRSDGTIYFTDPPYGIDPLDQELPFNGVFRMDTSDVLTAEYQGALAERPNGVVLSPDESTLYVSDTVLETVTAWSVAVDGSLSNPTTFATGVAVADGMCVDTAGNLYVSALSGVEVFAPDGMHWGTIAVPRQPSNCAFGGAGALTLYITAREGLYSVAAVVPGIP